MRLNRVSTRLVLAALGAVAAVSTSAGALTIVADSPDMLTPRGIYEGGSITFDGTTVLISRLLLHDPGGPLPTVPTPGPGFHVDSFFDIFYEIDFVAGGPPMPVDGLATGGVVRTVNNGGGGGGGAGGLFDTEMLALDLVGNTPLGPFRIRESPTLSSQGQTAITPIGGGMYHIDSFFDVFTELTLDGGQTWMPSNGPTHITLTGQTPEPASMSLVAIGAAVLLRRSRR